MFTKANYTVSKCASQPCNQRLCIDTPNSPSGYVCQCGVNDFRPTSCIGTNACTPNSCLNNGNCVSYSASDKWCSPNQYGQTCCQCQPGYTGSKCETGNFLSDCLIEKNLKKQKLLYVS